jgi:transcriptional regulator with XRE-family HTH domain
MQRQTGPPASPPEIPGYTLTVPTRVRSPRSRPKQAAHLVALRKQAGLTQTELADAIGVPQTTIANWEWSESPPRSEVLPRLAKVLGVRVEDVLASGKSNVPPALSFRPGPVGEVQRAFDEVRKLPRNQQRKILDTVFALVDRYRSQSQ